MIVEFKNIGKSFGRLRAVDGAAGAVRQGQTLSIVGESGSGKTTLAKIIAGLIKPDAGEIRSQGGIQMVFQDPYGSLDPMYNVHAILREAFYGKRLSRAEEDAQIYAMLEAVGLEKSASLRLPHEFSGGQRQRIAIARALMAKPAVLVLDEPTSALDVLVQKQVLDLLADLKARLGLTYIFISHNLRVVKRFSDTIMVMRAGKIIETGASADIFERPQHPYTRQLLSAALKYEVDA